MCACDKNGENDVLTTALEMMCLGCVVWEAVNQWDGRLEVRELWHIYGDIWTFMQVDSRKGLLS